MIGRTWHWIQTNVGPPHNKYHWVRSVSVYTDCTTTLTTQHKTELCGTNGLSLESCMCSAGHVTESMKTAIKLYYLHITIPKIHVWDLVEHKTFLSIRFNKETNSVALSPRANYTDWATATCWRNLVPTSADRGVSRGQRGGSPTVVNLSFLDRSRFFSFK
jgi:hypothetical protein